jgi:hypothetical protein
MKTHRVAAIALWLTAALAESQTVPPAQPEIPGVIHAPGLGQPRLIESNMEINTRAPRPQCRLI